MDINEFIESGILEEYCTGLLTEEDKAFVIQVALLYPEVKHELTQIELTLERFAEMNAVEVTDRDFKSRLLNSLDNYLNLNALPLIGDNQNHNAWLTTLNHLIPDEPASDMIFNQIRQDLKVTQTLVISKMDVPEETHADVLESILILKGECECTIGSYVFKAGPGNLIEVPLHVEHDIRITSPYVVAILQHVYL